MHTSLVMVLTGRTFGMTSLSSSAGLRFGLSVFLSFMYKWMKPVCSWMLLPQKEKGFFLHKEAHVCLVQSSLKADVCVCFFQETVTPKRAAPSSTAVMLPQRRASSMTARTWPCSRYKPAFCTNTRSGMIVRSRIHSLSQASDWIGVLTSINEGNYCVKGMWELQVNASKCHAAAGKNFKETICHKSVHNCVYIALSVGFLD